MRSYAINVSLYGHHAWPPRAGRRLPTRVLVSIIIHNHQHGAIVKPVTGSYPELSCAPQNKRHAGVLLNQRRVVRRVGWCDIVCSRFVSLTLRRSGGGGGWKKTTLLPC